MTEDVSEPVTFTARAGHDVAYTTDNLIQFPVTVTNIGGYYNNVTSIFLCPYDGIDMFFTALLTEDTNFNGRVKRQSAPLLGFHTFDVSESVWNLAVAECFTGQKVWVRNHNDDYFIKGHTA